MATLTLESVLEDSVYERIADEEAETSEADAGQIEQGHTTLELDDQIEGRFASWRILYDLTDDMQVYQLQQLVIESIRIERCQQHELIARYEMMVRAHDSWEIDRQAEITQIVAKLARNPLRWQRELLRSAEGCQWMIDEWKALRAGLDVPGGWDDRQKSRALDLLGIATIHRRARTPLDPPDGANDDYLIRQVEAEIEHLTEIRTNQHEERASAEKDAAMKGHTLPTDPMTMTLRRYEAGCQRRYYDLQRRLEPCRIKPPQADSTRRSRQNQVHSLAANFPSANQKGTVTHKTERCSDPRPVAKSVPVQPSQRATSVEVASMNPDRPKPTTESQTARPEKAKAADSRRERRKAAAKARKRNRR